LLLVGLWSWELLRVLLHGLVMLALALELGRFRSAKFNGWLLRTFPVFRHSEAGSFSGAFWLAVGYAMASWFPHPGSAAGILVGALADPAGALVGRSLGFRGRKSWQGTTAVGAVAGMVLGIFGLTWQAVLGGAVVAAAVERWSGPVNDNLLIAPCSAAICWLWA
jgi:dolichol kinase